MKSWPEFLEIRWSSILQFPRSISSNEVEHVSDLFTGHSRSSPTWDQMRYAGTIVEDSPKSDNLRVSFKIKPSWEASVKYDLIPFVSDRISKSSSFDRKKNLGKKAETLLIFNSTCLVVWHWMWKWIWCTGGQEGLKMSMASLPISLFSEHCGFSNGQLTISHYKNIRIQWMRLCTGRVTFQN